MRGLSLRLLMIVVTIGAVQCSPSPVAPSGPSGSPRPAAHLDCDSAHDIRARIDALEADGTLNRGRARALRNNLDQAERHEAAGRPDQVTEAYERLIEQVEGWVDEGTLSEEDMADLLACAEDVLDGPDFSLTAISAGFFHSCGLTPDGDAFCWGENTFGQLGDGNAGTDSATPVAVLGGIAFEMISVRLQHTCGVTTGGDAYCWGRNDDGQLGDGNLGTDSHTPVLVAGGHVFQSISAGTVHTCGVTTGGDAYCWGRNNLGQLGDGNVGTGVDTPVAVTGGLAFETISARSGHTCGVTTGGDAYCWGWNDFGQLGDGNAGTDTDTPVRVDGESFAIISTGFQHTCGVTTGDDAYCWGANHLGQLGDENTGIHSDTPVSVHGGPFVTISAGQVHTCGLTTGGDAYCWGGNSNGQLGDGNAGPGSDIPVLVFGDHAFETISGGEHHTCGVTSSGDGYCWGRNDSGQLGDGNIGTDSDIPVRVASP